MQRGRYTSSLFLFRRDLRLEDNTGLIEALQSSEEVIPCFILDPRQLKQNSYFSSNAFQFMVNSLRELDSSLRQRGARLHLFKGVAEEVVASILRREGVEAVFLNRDYTPFSKLRDSGIEREALKLNAHPLSYHDYLLIDPEVVLDSKGRPFKVFSHFYNRASREGVRRPSYDLPGTMKGGELDGEMGWGEILESVNPKAVVKGGRQEGLTLLSRLRELRDYGEARDFPHLGRTSMLSAHLKFGTVSVREVYWNSPGEEFRRQLYWRDFFTYIAYHFPHVFGQSFDPRYDLVRWENDQAKFRAWTQGRTGFPIVDAGMRELNETGYMHNRVRLIAASFLVKDLHVDWRWGERYFANRLTDYDPSVNNGNWQWVASTGLDPRGFRAFNPWLQQRKFDSQCLYIKKWVKELEGYEVEVIHNLYRLRPPDLKDYPPPMVNHWEEGKRSAEEYGRARQAYGSNSPS